MLRISKENLALSPVECEFLQWFAQFDLGLAEELYGMLAIDQVSYAMNVAVYYAHERGYKVPADLKQRLIDKLDEYDWDFPLMDDETRKQLVELKTVESTET